MMQARRIRVDEAREFWADKSQHLSITPDRLPDEGFEYWACGPVCGVFHLAGWEGVWMGHYGAKPEGWGRMVEPARTVLEDFWDAVRPQRIIGWTPEANRHALSFAKRLGFVVDGRMDLPSGAVIMQGWVK